MHAWLLLICCSSCGFCLPSSWSMGCRICGLTWTSCRSACAQSHTQLSGSHSSLASPPLVVDHEDGIVAVCGHPNSAHTICWFEVPSCHLLTSPARHLELRVLAQELQSSGSPPSQAGAADAPHAGHALQQYRCQLFMSCKGSTVLKVLAMTDSFCESRCSLSI